MNFSGLTLESLKPGIPKRYLLVVAACFWTTGGSMLLFRGFSMMRLFPSMFWLKSIASIFAGLIFYTFMFSKISLKHIRRIVKLEYEKPCLFSFLSFRSYFLMALMISFGIILRTTGIIPLYDLSVFYIAMGTPLIISALRFSYYGIYFNKAINKVS